MRSPISTENSLRYSSSVVIAIGLTPKDGSRPTQLPRRPTVKGFGFGRLSGRPRSIQETRSLCPGSLRGHNSGRTTDGYGQLFEGEHRTNRSSRVEGVDRGGWQRLAESDRENCSSR